LVTLSNGEKPISDIVARSGAKGVGEAGQTVRLIDIPAEPEGGFGAFENLHGFPGGGAFADHLMKATRTDYGYPLHEFLTTLVLNIDSVAGSYRGKVAEILGKFTRGIPGTDGETLRVAESFAILAAAGEVAGSLGITGWQEGAAEWGCGKCFKDWLKIHGTGATDDTAAMEWFQLLLERDGSSRFRPLISDRPDTQVRDQLGYRWKEADRRMFLLTPLAFKAECVREGYSLPRLLKHLDENQMLVKDEGRLQMGKKIDGSKVRGYAIQLREADDQLELKAA
jgi:putative DNA primase/helicase